MKKSILAAFSFLFIICIICTQSCIKNFQAGRIGHYAIYISGDEGRQADLTYYTQLTDSKGKNGMVTTKVKLPFSSYYSVYLDGYRKMEDISIKICTDAGDKTTKAVIYDLGAQTKNKSCLMFDILQLNKPCNNQTIDSTLKEIKVLTPEHYMEFTGGETCKSISW